MATPCCIEREVIEGQAQLVDWVRLGKRIRAAWRASRVPQGTIVAELDIQRQTMGAWMRGDRHPTTTNLERLADVIGAELVIDLVHPNEGRAMVVAAADAVEAARLLDALPDETENDPSRTVALRLLRVAHLFDERDIQAVLTVVKFHERDIEAAAASRRRIE